MLGTDAEIIRTVRRELGKRPVDSTRIDVQCVNGRITLAGTLAHLRSQPTVSLPAEVDLVTRILTRDRNIREVFNQINYMRQQDEQKPHESNTRGRTRR